MNDNDKLAAVVGAAFVAGVVYGSAYTRARISRELNMRKRMIANGIEAAVRKARTQNLTDEEFHKELDQELQFIQIVTNR